jgi:hypothetical protein
MMEGITDIKLQRFLDEALPAEEMSLIEQQLRNDKSMQLRMKEIIGQREAGLHSLGEIWRRSRLSCPPREQLGGFLLRALPESQIQYIQFHVETIGCRVCKANLEDLKRQRTEDRQIRTTRQSRYFQSSVGYIKE